MKLGTPHLIASLVMVAASIAYNVWAFTRPARRGAPAASPAPLIDGVGASGPVVTGEEPAAAIDPATIAPPPDVDLARAPEWRRNPFVGAWQPRAGRIAAPQVSFEAEPDPVVVSILHSAGRRLAVVNGRIVRAGDRVGSHTVVDVQPRALVVESARGARRLIELRTGPMGRDTSTAASAKAEAP